jgi:hypothetical protein
VAKPHIGPFVVGLHVRGGIARHPRKFVPSRRLSANMIVDMNFDKDKASLAVSVLALAVSIASPLVSYQWLNQVERDDRDRKQLIAWMVDSGGGGSMGSDFDNDIVSSVESFAINARKGGRLPVGNVQFLLQFDPLAIPYMKVKVQSDIETEPAVMDDEGHFRIRMKHPFAPTARDVRLTVEVSMTGHMKDRILKRMHAPLLGAWLYSDAIAGLPIPDFRAERQVWSVR